MNKDKAFIEERDAVIRERYARGRKHWAIWKANTSKAVAEELGVNPIALREAVSAGRPMRGIGEAALKEATQRVRMGQEHQRLYKQDCMQQICADWGVGNTTFERVVAEAGVEPDDPVHKFLTMRLVG